ncbi:LrgA-associated membrane protein LrgB [Clostridiaceae bacterium JG1575]|nr:LrgA-associated membrane protein LrgB [Clostridiaceae bacterium JG1575]
MTNWTAHPAFGLALTILTFQGASLLYAKIKNNRFLALLNPLLLATLFGIAFLSITKIPLEDYNEGAALLNFFLGPMVVTLALPLYRNRRTIRRFAFPIVGSIVIASLVSLTSVILLSRLLGLDEGILRSMLGKSTTTPIALEVATMTGGNGSLAVLGVILTGNIGVIFSTVLFRMLRIKSPVAKGIALGSSSHAIGTATALSLGKTEGAMAGLAIGICGIVTVLWLPILQILFSL